jgi:SLA1 Homology Domain 1 (SHD1) protein
VAKSSVDSKVFRSWNGLDGKPVVKAIFLGCRKGVVRLQKLDGNIIPISIDRLGQVDKDWIAKRVFGKSFFEIKRGDSRISSSGDQGSKASDETAESDERLIQPIKKVASKSISFNRVVESMPINRPSGKEFDLRDYWIKLIRRLDNKNSSYSMKTLSLEYAFTAIHRNENISAICGLSNKLELDKLALYLDKDEIPRYLCQYDNGERNGFLFVFDKSNKIKKIPKYIFDYSHGNLHGLACGFFNGAPKMILDYDCGQINSIYLLEGFAVVKSFDSEEKASDLAIIKTMLDDMRQIENSFTKCEVALKRRIVVEDEKRRKKNVILTQDRIGFESRSN